MDVTSSRPVNHSKGMGTGGQIPQERINEYTVGDRMDDEKEKMETDFNLNQEFCKEISVYLCFKITCHCQGFLSLIDNHQSQSVLIIWLYADWLNRKKF